MSKTESALHTKKRRKNGGNGKRRGNGDGTLMKKGNVYYALFYVRGEDGQKRRICQTTKTGNLEEARTELKRLSEKFATKSQAERRIEGRENLQDEKFVEKLIKAKHDIEIDRAEIEASKQAENDAKPALALVDAFNAFSNSTVRKDCGTRTLADYETQFNTFASWMHDNHPETTELRHVSKDQADAFAKHLLRTRSANTHNKYITLLGYVWDILTDEARITTNPWKRIAKKNVSMHVRRELTVEELTRVCEGLQGEMRILFALGIYTGLRLGDCATMDWGKIDLIRGLITTNPHKTDKTFVRIPLHPTLAGMLADIPEEKRRGFVLPETAEIYGRNASVLTNRIQKTFRRAGIQTSSEAEDGKKARVDVGFHSLRHTFVSLSANAGVPLAVVQSIVGHSNPVMTRHYFHASDDALKGAVAAIPDVIEATDSPAQLPPPAEKDKLSAIRNEIASLADAELVELAQFVNAEIKRRS